MSNVTSLTVEYTCPAGPAFYLTKADVIVIRSTNYSDAEEYMCEVYPVVDRELIVSVVYEANNCLAYLMNCQFDLRYVVPNSAKTVSFTLDAVDEIVMRAFLYRNWVGGNPVPKCKLDAMMYLRVKYNMELTPAKALMDAIDAQSQSLACLTVPAA